jgi:hypothetical protein
VTVPVLRRRPTVALAAAGLLLLVAAGAGAYGLLRGPDDSTSEPWSAPTRVSTPDRSKAATVGDWPATLPKTGDPTRYATAVAAALFTWDSTSGLTPADYTAPVLADADPSGEETPGLIGDVAGYEPTTEQWQQLAGLHVAQHLEITSAVVPSMWPRAVAQAHGQLRPGTTAITITGIRRRTGRWYGEPAATSTRVSFTVFLACAPAFSRCHTLRLSELNDPLR